MKPKDVALVCIAKDEDNYIEEWVEFHLKLGFDHVYIYENDWICTLDHPKITKIPFPGPQRQLDAYNHFITNHKRKYMWAAFFDVDEFLVLHEHVNIHDFLHEHQNKLAIGINWYIFGDNGHTDISTYNVIQRFTRREEQPDKHVKMIVQLQRPIKMVNPHFCDITWYDTNGNAHRGTPYNYGGPTNQAQLNHYAIKTRQEFKQKIARGRADHPTYRQESEFDAFNHNNVEDLAALHFQQK